MNRYEFFKAIEGKVNEMLGDRGEAVYSEVSKNNGIILHALNIKSRESNVSPSIYMDYFYDEYETGTESVEEAAEEILRLYEKHRVKVNFNLNYLSDFESVKGMIGMKMIDACRNKSLLTCVPYVPYLDLAIVFYVKVDHEDMGKGSILIKNDLMERWGVDEDELYRCAYENIRANDVVSMTHIFTMLKSMIPVDKINTAWMDNEEDTPMYVVTNEEGCFGATAMLYQDLLESFGDKLGKDYYILPCSIHELIILPICDVELEWLKEMVVTINADKLQREVVLSDSIYYFDREKKRVTRVA